MSSINAKVQKGDYLCVLGENGSGKTTLMKTVLGLIPPIGGEIVFGEGLEQFGIGYLPQQSAVQRNFPATVKEVVYSGCLRKGKMFLSKSQKAEALKNMRLLGVDKMLNKSYRNLSGGQQQRVLLARALCAADNILLLDEPAAGLDPAIMEEMYKLIESLNKSGMTIMMITHDVNAALRYANKILHISKKPAFFESVDNYKNKVLELAKGGVVNE
ncbi:MAG: ATP-binding cassette domain-containing protein [Eubacteriales bacterium]|nr:ATP-binding cassette domain-containing protein [Eubacteriales bacterium]